MHVYLRPLDQFGKVHCVAVHQVCEDMSDLENALYNADRDGFQVIYLYVSPEDVDLYASELPEDFYINIKVPQLRLVK